MVRPAGDAKVYDTRLAAGLFAVLPLVPIAAMICGDLPGWPNWLWAELPALLLYWRLRLDGESGVLRVCGVPVSCVVWREVMRFEVVLGSTVRFVMVSGRRREWVLSGFTGGARREIIAFLEEKIRPVGQEAPVSPDDWLRETLRKSRKIDRIAMVLWILLLGGAGAALLADPLIWDIRLRRWTQVPGVIERNDLCKDRSGGPVSKIAYSYRFRGRQYTGDRILYDNQYFPDWIKPGTPRKILVDPADPARSAAMLWYRGHWGLLRYAGPAACFAGLAAVLGVFAFLIRRRDRLFIPEKLRVYAAAHPASPPPEHRTAGRAGVTGPPEWVDGRFLRFRQPRFSAVVNLLLGAGFLAAALWLRNGLLLFWALLHEAVFFLGFPGSLLLDLRELRLTEKRPLRRKREISMAGVRMLCLSVKNNGPAVLSAVTGDGAYLRLCCVRQQDLQSVLDLLPDIAERMGQIPIAFAGK